MSDLRRGAHVLAGFALLVSVTAASQRLDAQGDAAPAIGARVRIVLDDSLRPRLFGPRRQAVVGTLTRITVDSVEVRVANDTLHLARAAIRGVSISRGASRSRSAAEQALLAGLMFANTAYRPGQDAGARGRNMVAAGAAGLALGALAGALWPYEHWRRVRP